MELVIIDHHSHDRVNAKVFKAETPERFYSEVHKYLVQDCDLIVADADPDGLLSAVIFRLGFNSIAPVQFVGEINDELIVEWHNKGIKRIISLDIGKWYSHMNRFDEVIILNPKDSGILLDINTTEIVYRSTGMENRYLQELNSLAIVADYSVLGAMESILRVLEAYPELFADALRLYEEGKLDQFTILETKIGKLTEHIWAGTIIDGKTGALHLIDMLVQHPFTLEELYSGAGNPVVQLLKNTYQRFSRAVKEEMDQEPETDGKLLIFEVAEEPSGLGRFVANKLASKYPDSIIAVKQKGKDGWKYSVRRINPEIDLGRLIRGFGCGGGHPRSAGAFAQNAREFEKRLADSVR